MGVYQTRATPDADLGMFSMFGRKVGAPQKDKIFSSFFCNMVTSQKY